MISKFVVLFACVQAIFAYTELESDFSQACAAGQELTKIQVSTWHTCK